MLPSQKSSSFPSSLSAVELTINTKVVQACALFALCPKAIHGDPAQQVLSVSYFFSWKRFLLNVKAQSQATPECSLKSTRSGWRFYSAQISSNKQNLHLTLRKN